MPLQIGTFAVDIFPQPAGMQYEAEARLEQGGRRSVATCRMAPCRLPAARATWVTWLAVLAAHSAASSVAPQLRFQDGVFKLVMLTGGLREGGAASGGHYSAEGHVSSSLSSSPLPPSQTCITAREAPKRTCRRTRWASASFHDTCHGGAHPTWALASLALMLTSARHRKALEPHLAPSQSLAHVRCLPARLGCAHHSPG